MSLENKLYILLVILKVVGFIRQFLCHVSQIPSVFMVSSVCIGICLVSSLLKEIVFPKCHELGPKIFKIFCQNITFLKYIKDRKTVHVKHKLLKSGPAWPNAK